MSVPTFESILKLCSSTAYPEPDSSVHAAVTPLAVRHAAAMLSRGSLILDVGCGNLLAAKEFASLGMVPVCVSVLQQEVDSAIAEGYSAHAMDMHQIGELGENKFDCVWMRHVAEHSPCPFLLLNLAKHVLKPAGILYLEIPWPFTASLHERNPNHWSVMTPVAWGSLGVRCGLKATSEGAWPVLTGAGPDCYHFFTFQK